LVIVRQHASHDVATAAPSQSTPTITPRPSAKKGKTKKKKKSKAKLGRIAWRRQVFRSFRQGLEDKASKGFS